jgi:hypothetical protein
MADDGSCIFFSKHWQCKTATVTAHTLRKHPCLVRRRARASSRRREAHPRRAPTCDRSPRRWWGVVGSSGSSSTKEEPAIGEAFWRRSTVLGGSAVAQNDHSKAHTIYEERDSFTRHIDVMHDVFNLLQIKNVMSTSFILRQKYLCDTEECALPSLPERITGALVGWLIANRNRPSRRHSVAHDVPKEPCWGEPLVPSVVRSFVRSFVRSSPWRTRPRRGRRKVRW